MILASRRLKNPILRRAANVRENTLCTLFAPNGLFRWKLNVPGETDRCQRADHPIAHVDFPPPQAVSGRGREGVMRIVPALAEREDADHGIVSALVVTAVGLPSPQMTYGIHTPCNVVHEKHAGQPAPRKPG
jgi:hypothetical protein